MDFIFEYKDGVHYFKIPEKEGTDFDIGDGCDSLYDIFGYPEEDEGSISIIYEDSDDEKDEDYDEDHDEDDDYDEDHDEDDDYDEDEDDYCDDDDYEMEESPTLYYETITDEDGKFSHIEVRIEEGSEGDSSYYKCTCYDIDPKELFEYLVGDEE